MIRVLIVTHGGLAEELLAAARTIAGDLPSFRALNLAWDEGLETARRRIAIEAAKLEGKSGVLILTDMYGSTPTNAALGIARPGHVEVVSGVNLPMVVRLACSSTPDLPVEEVARWLEIKGRRSISRAKPPAAASRDGEGTSGD